MAEGLGDAWEQARASRAPKDVVAGEARDASDLLALVGQTVEVSWFEFPEDVDGNLTGVVKHTERAALAAPYRKDEQ